MAFIQFCALHKTAVATEDTPRCSLANIGKILAPPTVALLLATGVLAPGNVLADGAPLIFDHDQSLAGANFSNRSDLRGSIFSKANCKGASFAGSDLTNAQLDDANFQDANFEGVTAVNVMATNTKFQRANLRNAGALSDIQNPIPVTFCT